MNPFGEMAVKWLNSINAMVNAILLAFNIFVWNDLPIIPWSHGKEEENVELTSCLECIVLSALDFETIGVHINSSNTDSFDTFE